MQPPAVPCSATHHNARLLRSRGLQGRVMKLIFRWCQTGESRYLEAVIRDIEVPGAWRKPG